MPGVRTCKRLISIASLVLFTMACDESRADPTKALISAPPGEQLYTVPEPALDLVRLDNPSQAAITRFGVVACISPEEGHLGANVTFTLRHAPGTPTSKPASFVLHRGLKVGSAAHARSPKLKLRLESLDRLDPRAHWRRPPYEALAGYEHGRTVLIHWDDPSVLVWPESIDLQLFYSGVIADSLRAPDVAYGRSFETTTGLIENRGAYLSGGTFWVPWRPDELFTFDLNVASPDGWRVVSQGGSPGRIEYAPDPFEGVDDGSDLCRGGGADAWRCPHPMQEIYLVAGPWEQHQQSHGDVNCMTFTYADTDSTIWGRYLRGTGRYLDLYEELIGPYPFEKFALVENFWQSGYGMPSFTLLGDRVIRLPFILDTSYGHEILHNWWGNGVFVDPSDGNWCEGLTVYGADYLYKERESPEAARQYRLDALKSYLDYVDAGEDFPLSEFRERHDSATQAIGYSKAMMVLHQIRRELGDEAFWQGLREFYAAHEFQPSSWTDLLRSFPRAQGRTIDPAAFRAMWLDRSGAPTVWLDSVDDSPNKIRLRQTMESGGEAWFAFDVPVRAQYEDGSTANLSISLSGATGEITAPSKSRLTRVEIDPDFEVMRRLHRSEIPTTLSRVLGADSIAVVLGVDLTDSMRAEAQAQIETWRRGLEVTVLEEATLPQGWSRGGAVWYLGSGSIARARAAGQSEIAWAGTRVSRVAEVETAGQTVVLAGTTTDGAESWIVLLPHDAASMRAVAEKIPHYGRYSYLLFEGSRNVGKGIWRDVDSPLKWEVRR